MNKKTIQEARDELTFRVICLRIAAGEHLTTALRKEVHALLSAHLTILEQPDFGSDVKAINNLDRQHDQFSAHWEKVHARYRRHYMLVADIIEYGEFLAGSLSQDYLDTGKPFAVSGWALEVACAIAKKKRGERKKQQQRLCTTMLSSSR